MTHTCKTCGAACLAEYCSPKCWQKSLLEPSGDRPWASDSVGSTGTHQGSGAAPPGPVSDTLIQRMAAGLRDLGYTQSAICRMLPPAAYRILRAQEAAPVEVPEEEAVSP